MSMKNVTITLEEEVIAAARALPEVQRTSLSAFVANLIRREVGRDPKVATEQLMAAMDAASKEAKGTWVWNRDEIYER